MKISITVEADVIGCAAAMGCVEWITGKPDSVLMGCELFPALYVLADEANARIDRFSFGEEDIGEARLAATSLRRLADTIMRHLEPSLGPAGEPFFEGVYPT